jgi:hypothetical protein
VCFLAEPYWAKLKMSYEGMFLHSRSLQAQNPSLDPEVSEIIEANKHKALIMLAENPFVKSEEDETAEQGFSARGRLMQDAFKQGQRRLAELNVEKQKYEEKLDQAAAASRTKLLAKFWCSRVKQLVGLRADVRAQRGLNYEKYTALILDAMKSLDVLARSALLPSAEDRAILQSERREARACINADGSTINNPMDAGGADASLQAGPTSSTLNESEIDQGSDEETLGDSSQDGSNAAFEDTFVAQPDEEEEDEEELTYVD